MDGNGHGKAETIQITGNVNMMATLVFTPNSSAVSIPMSQAKMLGARRATAAPGRYLKSGCRWPTPTATAAATAWSRPRRQRRRRSAVLLERAARRAGRADDQHVRPDPADADAGRHWRLVSRPAPARRRGRCLAPTPVASNPAGVRPAAVVDPPSPCATTPVSSGWWTRLAARRGCVLGRRARGRHRSARTRSRPASGGPAALANLRGRRRHGHGAALRIARHLPLVS